MMRIFSVGPNGPRAARVKLSEIEAEAERLRRNGHRDITVGDEWHSALPLDELRGVAPLIKAPPSERHPWQDVRDIT